MSSGRSPGTTGFKSAMSGSFLALACTPWSRSQPTAWFMLHRIREAWSDEPCGDFEGPVEVDESYFGSRRRNMSNSRRKVLADRRRERCGQVIALDSTELAQL